MHATRRNGAGTRSISAAGKSNDAHQHGVSQLPLAAAAQPLGFPQSGQSWFGSASIAPIIARFDFRADTGERLCFNARSFSTESRMRQLAALSVLALCACAAIAPANDRAALVAQANAWDAAIVRKDRRAIEANMAADFRQIDRRGRVSTRDEFLAGITDAALELDPYAVEDLDVRVYGDAALLSGTTRLHGRWNGEPFATRYRYTDVYARERDGKWRVVSVQITTIAE
jgi:ketosteroid isomerase-like protein